MFIIMLLFGEIHESDVLADGKDYFDTSYKVKKASRGAVFNKNNLIALMYVSRDNYYKLPGGGLERGEDAVNAFKREVMEETGAEAEVYMEVGLIIEYKNKMKKLQINYCYIGRVVDDTGSPEFTEKELEKGFRLKWVPFTEAYNLIANQRPVDYSARFISMRDGLILKRVRELLHKK